MKVIGKICSQHPELNGLQYARTRKGKPRAGTCVACSNLQGRKWRKENKGKYSISWRAWQKNNPDKVTKKERAYRERNKEKIAIRNKKWRSMNSDACREKDRLKRVNNGASIKLRMRKWYEKNRHVVYATNAKRRALEEKATPSWANQFFISEAYHLARLRSRVTGYKWSVDHVVPLKSKIVCGLNCEHNLRVIPLTKNVSKNNRYWPDMAGGA